MMRALPIVAVALAVAVSGGCGKNTAVKYSEQMADDVCACADLACAEAVRKKGLEDLPKVADATGFDSDERAIRAAGARMKECQDRLATGR
jgi:hypothetical protein